MNRRRLNAAVWMLLITAGALVGACRRTYTYAVVPRPNGPYRPDTLRAFQNGNEVYVIFRFDTVTHTRTLYRTDTLWREGKQIIHDTVRLVRRDTLRIVRRDTVRRVDTVRVPTVGTQRMIGRDTVIINRARVDTVHVVHTDTIHLTRSGPARVDTVRVYQGPATRVDTVRVMFTRVDTVRVAFTRVDTVRVMQQGPARVDTVRLSRIDTVRLTRVDTVRLTRVDTVRVTTGGKRTLRVPPGQYPPEGKCRVWIEGVPPGRQRDAAACDALGDIPAGAFILFGGEAYDFDYDWVANPSGAPPQIVALKRKR